MSQSVMPKNVVRFERLGYFTVIFGGLASIAANWQIPAKYFSQYSVVYLLVIALSFAIQLGWIWMIARKRQNWARWVSVFFIVVAVLVEIFKGKSGFEINPAAEIVKVAIYALWIIEFSLLFTNEAKAWFVFPSGPEIESDPLSPTGA